MCATRHSSCPRPGYAFPARGRVPPDRTIVAKRVVVATLARLTENNLSRREDGAAGDLLVHGVVRSGLPGIRNSKSRAADRSVRSTRNLGGYFTLNNLSHREDGAAGDLLVHGVVRSGLPGIRKIKVKSSGQECPLYTEPWRVLHPSVLLKGGIPGSSPAIS